MGSTRVLKNSKSRDGAAVEAEGFCAAGCEVLIIVSTARATNKLVFTITSIHSDGQAHCRTTITASALVASAAHENSGGTACELGMSRPSEKFRFEPSRKFLWTAARLKDGTNRDESTGTGLVGVVEADAGWDADAEAGGREDGSDGPLVGSGSIDPLPNFLLGRE